MYLNVMPTLAISNLLRDDDKLINKVYFFLYCHSRRRKDGVEKTAYKRKQEFFTVFYTIRGFLRKRQVAFPSVYVDQHLWINSTSALLLLSVARFSTCESTITNNTAGKDAWGGEQQSGRPPPPLTFAFCFYLFLLLCGISRM
jgi:hypothetical protein